MTANYLQMQCMRHLVLSLVVQMLETARAEVISLKQQLHDSQLTLADRQLALASECKATKDGLLQACPMLQQLSSPLLQQQQEQQQEPKQHGEASALTSSKQQVSTPLQQASVRCPWYFHADMGRRQHCAGIFHFSQ